MEKITLVCTTHNPDLNLLENMLNSTYLDGCLFDNLIVHWNGKCIRSYNKIGKFPYILSIPEAYNYLIKNVVDTEWVCCFCDDDYFYPEGLAKMIAEVHEGIVAGVAHYKFHISGHVPPEDKRCWFGRKEYDLCEQRPVTASYFKRHNRLPAGSFFRKRAWEMAGGFQGTKCHDWNLWKRMAEVGIEFKYFDYLVYNHVRRPNSAWIKQNA
jgi:glycosyltransferase involved in cell wall biosynthesis